MPTRKTTAKKTTSKKRSKKTTARKPPAAAKKWKLKPLYAQLEKLGTAQNRKIFARHGAPDDMFGVSFANIYALQKQIKRDHDLALELWDTGNADAQTLAALIADPDRATRTELSAWARSATWFMTIDYLASFVATTPHAIPLATKWMAARKENIRRAGYSTLASLLKNGAPLDTDLVASTLDTIEREIHDSPNRAREAMNTTLICIGTYRDDFHKKALAAAKRIGFVEIDHGDNTNCKDFIATDEIAKARAHRAKKKTKKAAR